MAAIVTSNSIQISPPNSRAQFNAPAGTQWFFLIGSNQTSLMLQFDNEAPINFPRRTMLRRAFKTVVFIPVTNTPAFMATFQVGIGTPPEYPPIEECVRDLLPETSANALIPANGTYSIVPNSPQMSALWVSCPVGAANSLFVTILAAQTNTGIEIAPGTTKRIPVSAMEVCVANPGVAPVQASTAYEMYG